MSERLFKNTEEEMPLFFFEDISMIPRESGNEEAVGDFLMDFADGLGLDHEKDPAGNVIIRKPGSKGREDEEPLIMQAHMDMVCEKLAGSPHDFSKDPIELLIDGDMLRAKDTTLGADDGIGVALCMAALADESLSHPPLEILITVEEETTFKGAASADPKYFRGRRIINLDHANEHQVLSGSAGGVACRVRIPVSKEKAPGRLSAYEIEINGLNGGHSGEDIHRGYGSAIQILTRLLRRSLENSKGIKLLDIAGGTNRLAISRDAKAWVAIPEGSEDAFRSEFDELANEINKEYAVAGKDLKISLNDCGMRDECFDDASFRKIIDFMTLTPDGIQKMSGAVLGVVESSLNIGELRVLDGELEIVTEIRGSFPSTVNDIEEKLETAARLFGGSTEKHDRYSAWSFDPDSELRSKAIEVYKDLFGEDLESIVVHAGIEIGLLMDSFKELDAISLGPDCWSFHSPDEHVSISSTKREWKFIKKLLEAI